MRIRILTTAAMALVMGFTSCNNDDVVEQGGNALKGERTSMQFLINFPSSLKTYAPDSYATTPEIEMNEVKVLIYELTGSGYVLEQAPVTLGQGDFENYDNANSLYKLKESSKIPTTTGPKRIFVAMNFPGTLPAQGTLISDMINKVHTLTASNQLSSNGLAMFSTEVAEADLVAETHVNYPTANTKDITLKRLVAKVTVEEGAALRDGDNKIMSLGGEITDVKFAVGHVNKTTYVLQNIVGAAPDKVVQDFNWLNSDPSDFFGIAATDYKAINANGAALVDLRPIYFPENTVKDYETDGSNVTYVSITAKYTPAVFVKADGSEKLIPTAPESFWTVTLADGKLYYFNDETEATAFKTANAGSKISNEYVGGACYWRGYLNKDGVSDSNISGSKAAPYDVLRNTYYKAVLSGLKAPGFAEDKGDIIENTTLLLNVYIQPWAYVDINWSL